MPRCTDVARWWAILLSSMLAWVAWIAAQPPAQPVKRHKPATPVKVAPPQAIDTRFIEVQPIPHEAFSLARSPGQVRAVVLIHGLRPHLFSNKSVGRAEFQDWQRPASTLVQALSHQADVYAFAYSENAVVDAVADVPALHLALWRLGQLGYREIVLIGHSAGGLVAREYVEDHPRSPVTKVIEVCAPNAGSGLANVDAAVRAAQRAFMGSLTPEGRAEAIKQRAGKQIPAGVQFLCVIGNGAGVGDGMVTCHSQWPEDLQRQGIPALTLRTTHFTVMRSKSVAERLTELIARPEPRLSITAVDAVRRTILGK